MLAINLEDIISNIEHGLLDTFQIINCNAKDNEIIKQAIQQGKFNKLKKIIIHQYDDLTVRHYETIKDLFEYADSSHLITIEEIRLSNRNLGDSTIEYLVRALEAGAFPNIKRLDLDSTAISSNIKLRIIKAVDNQLSMDSIEYLNISNKDNCNDDRVPIALANLLIDHNKVPSGTNIKDLLNHYPYYNVMHHFDSPEIDTMNSLYVKLLNMHLDLFIYDHKSLQEARSYDLVFQAKYHNDLLVKYILDRPNKFPIILNTAVCNELMRIYKDNREMQEYIFSKLESPFPPLEQEAENINHNNPIDSLDTSINLLHTIGNTVNENIPTD